MDVKTAFLNRDLNEIIFMAQPEGFAIKGKEHRVFLIGAITISGVRIYAITIQLFRNMPLQF